MGKVQPSEGRNCCPHPPTDAYAQTHTQTRVDAQTHKMKGKAAYTHTGNICSGVQIQIWTLRYPLKCQLFSVTIHSSAAPTIL